MELMNGGHLGKFIKESGKKGKEITEKIAKKLIKQVLEAIFYLHTQRIIHRDIKPENILLDDLADPKTVKISDFGLSVKHDKITYEGLQAQCGTELYRAPEQLAKSMYSKVEKT
jgi:serine/threonine protein kinase